MPTLKPKLAKECNLPNAQDCFVNFEIVDLKPSSEKPAKVWLSFTAPLVLGANLKGEFRNPKQIQFCEFASTGNTWGEDSRY